MEKRKVDLGNEQNAEITFGKTRNGNHNFVIIDLNLYDGARAAETFFDGGSAGCIRSFITDFIITLEDESNVSSIVKICAEHIKIN